MWVHTHIRPANWRVGPVELPNCYQLGRVAFRAEVASPLESAVCFCWEEVRLFLCVSIVSAEYLPCHVGTEGIRPSGFDKALPGVVPSQPSSFYAQETEHPASSPLGPRREVLWTTIAFSLMRPTKSLLWPFSPHSRPGACRTVPTVPALLASP